MSSASKQFELEKKLKEAEKKIALCKRLSNQLIELQTERVTQLTKFQTEKISQLELKLKESLQADADCAMKLSGLERQLQQSQQSNQKLETSFNSMQAKFNVTKSEVDNAMLRISASGIDADPRVEVIKGRFEEDGRFMERLPYCVQAMRRVRDRNHLNNGQV